jgi:hypothetical protein
LDAHQITHVGKGAVGNNGADLWDLCCGQ